ncbi:MAG: SpoIID/LytB domain-containing protein [Synechococcales cyanobacterium C42_A2020_086]|nr:SpoIID/LytB domain-containing protein [Synechococcales cyanobacterium M58_A2018_015]MBF2076115.1 SpoIID/LytB domain-containing protein [Synechococcales cyanobacterium C42_A2020_086]
MTFQSCAARNSEPVFQLKQLVQHVLHQGQKSWWMALVIWLVAIAPAKAELELRVAIEQDASQVKIGSSSEAVLRDGTGQVLAQIPAMNAVIAESKSGAVSVNQLQTSQLWVEPKSADGYVFISDRWYRGRTLVVPTSGGITAVNYVDLEQYLYSVVGAEMPASWSLEALKAQAVAARSYALYHRQNSANAVFDLGDTTAWQVYSGLEKEAPSTRAAVDATQGQVLTYNGQIINAVFHSCAGGHTENVEDVWSNPLPYLRGVVSPDGNLPECQWRPLSFTASELSQRLGYSGTISSVEVERHPHGRVLTLRISGSAGQMEVSGKDVRDRLGLRSTLFSVEAQRGQVASAGDQVPASPAVFRFSGSGNGHGIGMSQYGANVLARQNWNYQQILLHYYKGVTVAKIQVQ